MPLDNNSLPLSDAELEHFLEGLGISSETPSKEKSYDIQSLSSLLETIDSLTKKKNPSEEEEFVFEPLPDLPSSFPTLIYDGSDVWYEPKRKRRQWPKRLLLYGSLLFLGWWIGYGMRPAPPTLAPIHEKMEHVSKQIDELREELEVLQTPYPPIEFDPFPWLPKEEEVIEPLDLPPLDHQLASVSFFTLK